MLPTKTYAAEGDVARVVETGEEYATLDEAIAEAPEGSTIELLGDARIDTGFNKTLVFTGSGTITTDKQLTSNGEGWMCFGLYDTSRVLTLKGEGITWNWESDGSSPWLMLSLSGTFNVEDGATMRFIFDSRTTGTRNAIYMNAGSSINVSNGSHFEIVAQGTEGNSGQGIQLDSAGKATINVTGNSEFLVDGTNRGYVNSPTIYVENSDFTVRNCTNNASNGGIFTAVNSNITFEDNRGHGLSATTLSVQGSTLNCNRNGYYGITYSGDADYDTELSSWTETYPQISSSIVNANGNGYDYTGGGIRAAKSASVTTVAAGVEINVKNNQRNGVENYGTFTFVEAAEGETASQFNVINNHEPSTNGGGIFNGGTLTLPSTAVITGNYAEQTGGGICNAGTVTVPEGAQLYNNHAGNAGDDLYNRDSATAQLIATGSDWMLDNERLTGHDPDGASTFEADDCTDAIDGWYVDAEGARWEAHASDPADNIVELYPVSGTTTVEGPIALKAAHGITATFTPADITIYMGGTEGYESVVQGSQGTGDVVDSESNSLPEPGFYIELPECINNALKAEVGDTPGAVDLSHYITMRTRDNSRSWTLEMYGETNSVAYDRFVYRVVSPEGQDPVRLQFTSGDQFFVSDEFDPSTVGALSNQYVMGVYPGEVDQKNIVMDVEIGEKTYTYTVELETGMLNVRYVTGEQAEVVTDVLASIEDAIAPGERAYAIAPKGTRYTINESNIDVTDSAAPSLLFDDVVTDDNTTGAGAYDEQLAGRAQTVAAQAGAELVQPAYEAKYLDLVDANNGNVWIKASEPVTVYWPYPAGTDENTEFHLVHFEGLDRELSNGEISGAIDSANAVYVEVENAEHGVRFTTDSFSPFVLIWDDAEEPTRTPTPDEPPTKPEETEQPEQPEQDGTLTPTGDNSLALLGVAAAAGVVCVATSLAIRKREDA